MSLNSGQIIEECYVNAILWERNILGERKLTGYTSTIHRTVKLHSWNIKIKLILTDKLLAN